MDLPVKTVLVDRRSPGELRNIADAMAKVSFIGIDCETHDANRHEGLNRFCKYDDEGYRPKNAKLVFDTERTTVCGFSIFPEGGDTAWYMNLAHKDEENRLPWGAAKELLDSKPKAAHWVAHNAPFELTMFGKALGYELEQIICTLQMAVSAYGPDEYNKQAWIAAGLGDMEKFVVPLMKHSLDYSGGDFDGDLAEIVVKIIAKESRATHSYNGFCAKHAYGYGLKKLVSSFFDRQMSTFEETIGENAHMGQLTGEQVAAYGAEDAYWVLPVMRRLMAHMAQHSPNAMRTFFTQENPMIHIYSDMWREGVRINKPLFSERRDEERTKFSDLLRQMKGHVRELLPFPAEPDARLMKREKWYSGKDGGAWKRYRAKITDWAAQPDPQDPFLLVQQVRGAVSKAWAQDRGELESPGVNLTHYMPMRTLLYDLIGAPLIMSKGKVQSNGEARGKIGERLEKKSAEVARLKLLAAESGEEVDEDPLAEDDDPDLLVIDEGADDQRRREIGVKIIDCLTKMSGCEQRMKLFLTPYLHLTDPDTGRMYPNVTSMLATRRMAASNPNPMQLQKRGEGTYVREGFLGDVA